MDKSLNAFTALKPWEVFSGLPSRPAARKRTAPGLFPGPGVHPFGTVDSAMSLPIPFPFLPHFPPQPEVKMNPKSIRKRERWSGKRPGGMSVEDVGLARSAGYEPGPDGYFTGRDPQMSQAELLVMGFEAMPVLAAIRAKCLDCCAGSPHEVRLCVAVVCPSWPFRMGTNPWREKRVLSEEERDALRERFAASRIKSGASEPHNQPGENAGTVGDASD